MPMMFSKHAAALLSAAFLALPFHAETYAKAPEKRQASAAVRKVAMTQEDTGEFVNFAQWQEVNDFIEQMVTKHGFERTQLEAMFKQVRYVDTAIQLIKPAPLTKPKNWQAYRARFIDPVRIKAGAAFWEMYADTLARAEERYGVPAEIIVGIIGVETVYGRNTGNFRVLDVLTTLGFDYPPAPNRVPRMEFFRREVEQTLLFARESQIDPFDLHGSYAGAVGWPQFMPGSIRKYAVDFDGDGKVDLRNSPIDAIGSVANFLVEHGWQPGTPLVFPAVVAAPDVNPNWQQFIGQGLEAKFTLDELVTGGVAPRFDPPRDIKYGLVDLQNGMEPTEYWLGAANFFAITKYNRSFFYAMSVIDLGQAVKAARSR
jgi:membrane-bound lytic murein transglycosylase B